MKAKPKGFNPRKEWSEEINKFLVTSERFEEVDALIKTINYTKKELKFLEDLLVNKREELEKFIKKEKLTPLTGYYKERYLLK